MREIKQYTAEQLIEAVKNSKNKSEMGRVLFKGQTSPKRLQEAISKAVELKLDMNHWSGRYFRKNTGFSKRKPITEISKAMLRKKVLTEKLLEEKCSICNLKPVWNNKPLSLQIDHINGDGKDHRMENLRFLCPNCHSQTETWGAKRFQRLPKNDDELLELKKQGMLYKDIAVLYNVHHSTVSHRLRKYNNE